MIDASVIIPNLHSPIVDQTIRSILSEKCDWEYEILVVGMDRYGIVEENEKVRFIRSTVPLSPACARNLGANQAQGKILVFIDADCIAQENWLNTILEKLVLEPEKVIGGGVRFEGSNYWNLSDNLSMFHEFYYTHPAGERRHLPSLNLAILREVFFSVGGFDERYPKPSSEDTDLTIRLRKTGHRLLFEPGAVVLHQPPRNDLRKLLIHGFNQGKYSTKVDPRYRDENKFPWVFRSRILRILLTPILASGATLRVFWGRPQFLRYGYTLPAIFLSKIAWCLGSLFASQET